MENREAISIISSILLLFLSLSGNFLAQGISCSIQRLLHNNIYVKQFMILCITYFTISFSSNDIEVHPFRTLLYAVLTYIVFLLFQRTTRNISIIVF